MSLYVASLNSGSNGNCYYIGNEDEAVLIDAGISCRETERRMRQLGLQMGRVKAVFISHEHGDHIRGTEGISSKHQLPVYITAATLRQSRLRIKDGLVNNFSAYEQVQIGGLSVLPFPKKHDAIDPYSFTISGNGVTIGVLTDIGVACADVVNNFKRCHAAFLEANYDEIMLERGRYPHHLKQRIRGGHGHLSNSQALALFQSERPSFMSHLFLSHLSKDNNDPAEAHRLFAAERGETDIVVASRYEATGVFRITDGVQVLEGRPAQRGAVQARQISLF